MNLPTSVQTLPPASILQSQLSQPTLPSPTKRKRKDAPRERTGCWTCRIRGKKCPGRESVDIERCPICSKLDIDCLGWGPKIPDDIDRTYWKKKWTQELEAKGKIKGRAKAAMSNMTLTMSAEVDLSRSDSGSGDHEEQGFTDRVYVPASNGMNGVSMSSGGPSWGFGNQHFAEQAPPLITNNIYHMPLDKGKGPGLAADPVVFGVDDDIEVIMGESTNSASISPEEDYNIFYGGGMGIPASFSVPSTSALVPVHNRSFDAWNLYNFAELEHDSGESSRDSATSQQSTMFSTLPQVQDELFWFNLYQADTRPMQYLVHDTTSMQLQDIMNHLAASFSPSVMAYLAVVRQRQLNPALDIGPFQRFLTSAISSLFHPGPRSEHQAMVAIHLISVSLFEGCTSDWAFYLQYARDWFEQEVRSGKDMGMILKRDPLTAFASKTTIWMDIFGAISSRTRPRFLDIYRVLFAPEYMSNIFNTNEKSGRLDIDMDMTMGAENDVMLAFAEIAALDAWKAEETRKRGLSVPQLARQGQKIFAMLLPSLRSYQNSPDSANKSFFGPFPELPPNFSTGPSIPAPLLMSAVFRASAKVYLHTVLSGFNPAVIEISEGVTETIRCLKSLQSTNEKPYDRSLVLPLFIAGVMTNDLEQRVFIKTRLTNIKDVAVGNCGQVLALMEAVWQRRVEQPDQEISWRDVMKEMNMSLLFV